MAAGQVNVDIPPAGTTLSETRRTNPSFSLPDLDLEAVHRLDRRQGRQGFGITAPEQLDQGADAHGPEQLQCCFRPALSGLVDLAGRHGFRKRKRPVFHHYAAQDRDEENSKNPAQDHQ